MRGGRGETCAAVFPYFGGAIGKEEQVRKPCGTDEAHADAQLRPFQRDRRMGQVSRAGNGGLRVRGRAGGGGGQQRDAEMSFLSRVKAIFTKGNQGGEAKAEGAPRGPRFIDGAKGEGAVPPPALV